MNSPHELSLRVNSLYVSGKIFVLKSCGQYVVTFDADTVRGVKWTAGCIFFPHEILFECKEGISNEFDCTEIRGKFRP